MRLHGGRYQPPPKPQPASGQSRDRDCQHTPEAHVVYDMQGAGYRGRVCCRCGGITVTHPRLRERHTEAEADARAMINVIIP